MFSLACSGLPPATSYRTACGAERRCVPTSTTAGSVDVRSDAGIRQALVEEALRRGAKRVYGGTRQPLIHPDARVTPLTLDVTNAGQIDSAVEMVESLDVLVNNAGIARYDEFSDPRCSKPTWLST